MYDPPVILSVERRTSAAGPRTLSYLATGPFPNERVVVFLHAFPLNAGMWLPQLQGLPEGWSGIAPDFRGFGGSDPDAEDASRSDSRLEDYADDVAALMDTLGASSAALCPRSSSLRTVTAWGSMAGACAQGTGYTRPSASQARM